MSYNPGMISHPERNEMHLEGVAIVESIEDCPPIDGGPGSVVTARIVTTNAHELARVVFAAKRTSLELDYVR